jgi:2-polyprenyl-6-methoxyphenol hydroxylase-like FAD-dependent oxidoreductase
LIGDAAHLAVPFTSAGTTNALLDAKTLTKTLMNSSSIEQAPIIKNATATLPII